MISCLNTVKKLNISDVNVSEPKVMANELNNYFCEVGPNLTKSLPSMNVDFTQYMGKPIANSFVCSFISHNELYNTIAS